MREEIRASNLPEDELDAVVESAVKEVRKTAPCLSHSFQSTASTESPSFPHFLRQIVLVESPPDEPLDQGLPTDIEFPGSLAQFLQHSMVQINPDVPKGRHHLARVRKIGRDIASVFSEPSN